MKYVNRPERRQLRVLLLSHVPNDENAGASRIYHLLAAGLRARGHAVDLFHLEDMGLPRSPRLARAMQRTMMPTILSQFGLRRADRGYDVIMASSGMAGPMFQRLRRAKSTTAMVNHLHGLAIYDHLAAIGEGILGHGRTTLTARLVTGPLQARWDEHGVRAADLTIVQNRRDLAELGIRSPARALSMIPAAVHPDILAASAAAGPLDRRTSELLWFAAWQPRKGCHYLPNALRIVRAQHPETRLLIGGTGLTADRLLPHFASEDRAAITVLPRISVAEQAELFARAAIIVFPSLSEGFGLALAEAMSFGLAAVAGATGFAADFLQDGRNARIVPPSADHIGRAICDLIERPDLRAAIAGRGRTVARRFTSERMVDAYEHAFLTARWVRQKGNSALA